MSIKNHASSSQIVNKKKKKLVSIGNSNDKKLYVNKSGAMMLIKKVEKSKMNDFINTTLSNNKLNNNINNSKKNNQNICSSFRHNNAIGIMGSKLQNTISFGNNNLSKVNMNRVCNIKKSGNKNENDNIFCNNNNIITSTNLNLL